MMPVTLKEVVDRIEQEEYDRMLDEAYWEAVMDCDNGDWGDRD